jgi:hypothetical protein
VPDRRVHRGPHPEDARLFTDGVGPLLCQSTTDLRWLLSRGYAPKSALKLVGDRYGLVARQRTAVGRCACSDLQADDRRERRISSRQVRGQTLWLDGYNVLVSVEAALSGGLIIVGCDGAYRDMASMHGSYRKVSETRPALELIGRTLAALEAGPCRWYLDSPVSNSGRLMKIIREVAAQAGWDWDVELVPNPDTILSQTEHLIVTADSAVLDLCGGWFDLAKETIGREVPQAWILNLGGR